MNDHTPLFPEYVGCNSIQERSESIPVKVGRAPVTSEPSLAPDPFMAQARTPVWHPLSEKAIQTKIEVPMPLNGDPVPHCPTVLEIMDDARHTYEIRGAAYGDSADRVGPVLAALFPNGVTLKTSEDFLRYNTLGMIVAKLTRYTTRPAIGHIDSIHDIGVYAFMLEKADRIAEAGRSDSDL